MPDRRDDGDGQGGSTLVPIPRRHTVSVTSVRISDLASPGSWDTVEEDVEPTEIVGADALDRAADMADEIEERGSVLDAELRASFGELIQSIHPPATKTSDPESEPELAPEAEGGAMRLVEVAVVAGVAGVVALVCAAGVLLTLL